MKERNVEESNFIFCNDNVCEADKAVDFLESQVKHLKEIVAAQDSIIRSTKKHFAEFVEVVKSVEVIDYKK